MGEDWLRRGEQNGDGVTCTIAWRSTTRCEDMEDITTIAQLAEIVTPAHYFDASIKELRLICSPCERIKPF